MSMHYMHIGHKIRSRSFPSMPSLSLAVHSIACRNTIPNAYGLKQLQRSIGASKYRMEHNNLLLFFFQVFCDLCACITPNCIIHMDHNGNGPSNRSEERMNSLFMQIVSRLIRIIMMRVCMGHESECQTKK